MRKWQKLILLGTLLYILYVFVPKNTVYKICLSDGTSPIHYVVRNGLFGGHYIIEDDIGFLSALPSNKLKIHLARDGFSEPYFQIILVESNNRIDAYSSNYLESNDEFTKINVIGSFTRDKWEDLYSKRFSQDHIFLEKNKVHCPKSAKKYLNKE